MTRANTAMEHRNDRCSSNWRGNRSIITSCSGGCYDRDRRSSQAKPLFSLSLLVRKALQLDGLRDG